MSTKCKDYDFREIEPHWQSFWDRNRTFRADDASPRPKYYVLDMFPYPSGAGLHIGHPEGYTGTDIVARYRRTRGFKVLHPMGWDAFGLPAEQHAVKTGTPPAANTRANITNFRRQIKALGFSYDWDREIDTTDPRYFRWTQWIFLQLFRRGLAYVDERPVWWCPELRTVLANEEVIEGRSEVGGFPVERRNLRQWVLRITAYAERLLADLKEVDWPESTKRMQEAWIGRSEGAEIVFSAEAQTQGGEAADRLIVFTTRADTLFGATYLVLAPEHPFVDRLTPPDRRAAVDAYRRQAASKSDLERTDLAKDKTGVFSGAYAVNPVNAERIPIWIADYVLMGYGTGAIMAVPAHDRRDYEFARRYGLEIRTVVKPDGAGEPPDEAPYTGEEGRLVGSGGFTGRPASQARRDIVRQLQERGLASPRVNYKLRDWLFSRQRYWGEPFPIVWVGEEDYAKAVAVRRDDLPADPVTFTDGGQTLCALPLPESALPLPLPEVASYQPGGNGESPLANATAWVDVWLHLETGRAVPASQPRPGDENWVRARRETNTMPQWAGSCWYYLRFTDPHNDRAPASKAALRIWGTPDLYVGGAEHAVLHLLYARFWHKALYDIGLVPDAEPFRKLFHQGIILGEDGEKMSKSRGNVVNPDTVIESHGADSLRLYLMFLGPLEASKPWNPRNIEGVHRFLHKVWRECIGVDGQPQAKIGPGAQESPEFRRTLHETIRKVGEDIEALRLNTAISQLMICSNALQREPAVSIESIQAFLRLLAPFAPHLAEELWERLGGAAPIHEAGWPAYDPAALAAAEVKLVVQVDGRHRADLIVPVGTTQEAAVALALGHPKVEPFLAGRPVRRVVYVPNRILNLVVGVKEKAPA